MKSNKLIKISLFTLISISLNIIYINASDVDTDEMRAKGLAPFTVEEQKKLDKNKIKKVKANRLAVQRLNKELKEKGLPTIDEPTDAGSDIEIDYGASSDESGSGAIIVNGATPSLVDNSSLSAFPNIGNQGSLPSCVAWATTYYQMSHEVCLTLGCDNKIAKTKIFSPKWTYNFINGGVSTGTYFSDAFSVMTSHGVALYSEFPYDSNYRAWSLEESHWKNAIKHRMSAVSNSTNDTDAGIEATKQLLANGHVLVIGTYISSWVFGTVGSVPNQVNPFAGQQAMKYQNGTNGAHACRQREIIGQQIAI